MAELIRVAFPADSDRETARRAAAVLGYSERSILNWLRCETSAPFDVAFALGCTVGVFRVMDVMTRGESRSNVWGMISQGVRRVCGQ